jgi:hypothetical protein
MLAPADSRRFLAGEDRFQRCAFCNRELVVLPNDRRGGACFDCLVLLGAHSMACPVCGTDLAPVFQTEGCPECGWRPAGTVAVPAGAPA